MLDHEAEAEEDQEQIREVIEHIRGGEPTLNQKVLTA